jgi:hypothetical protein
VKRVLLENFIKNIFILPVLVFSFFEIQNFFEHLPTNDSAVLGSILVAVSILAVTACFGCFAFTYEKVEHASLSWRLLAHVTTGLLILLIGLSLEMTFVLLKLLVGEFYLFGLSLGLLYLTVVLYDFWDLKRAKLHT